jgi:mono/diheme cytochrome c family protein
MSPFRKMSGSMAVIAAMFLVGCGGGGEQSQTQQKTASNAAQSGAAQTTGLQPGDAVKGQPLFVTYCSACHGPDAKGIKGLGRDLTHNEWVEALSDSEFLAYVNQGRAADDPRNVSGVPMPPKGGNPALTDQEIMHIIAHVRSLQ